MKHSYKSGARLVPATFTRSSALLPLPLLNDVLDLLYRLENYMENKSDSMDLETGGIAPNKEMLLHQEITAAIEKLKNEKS